MATKIVKGTGYKLQLSGGFRDSPQRRLGLGGQCSDSDIRKLLREAMGCPVSSVPVIEHTTLDIGGPDTDEEILQTFGAEVDFFNAGKVIPGVDQVQTTFVHPGILQTGMIVMGVGFHIFAEPMCFTAEGNVITPPPTTAEVQPVSLNAFTDADQALLGLDQGQLMTPGILEWGWPMQYAAWHFINGYNFDWVVRQRYHILSESARYIAHFPSFASEMGAGTSEVPVLPFMRMANQRLIEKGGSGIILPIDRVRQGAFNQLGTEASVARTSRDFDLARVTYGGLGLQTRVCNGPFHKLALPYFIPANSPIGLQLNQSDDLQAGLFRQWLSITDAVGGTAPPIETAFPNIVGQATVPGGAAIFGAPFNELSLDTPAVATTKRVPIARAIVKGGILQMSLLLKGWETTDEFATAMQSTALKSAIQSEFGIQFCG